MPFLAAFTRCRIVTRFCLLQVLYEWKVSGVWYLVILFFILSKHLRINNDGSVNMHWLINNGMFTSLGVAKYTYGTLLVYKELVRVRCLSPQEYTIGEDRVNKPTVGVFLIPQYMSNYLTCRLSLQGILNYVTKKVWLNT